MQVSEVLTWMPVSEVLTDRVGKEIGKVYRDLGGWSVVVYTGRRPGPDLELLDVFPNRASAKQALEEWYRNRNGREA